MNNCTSATIVPKRDAAMKKRKMQKIWKIAESYQNICKLTWKKLNN
jgi:hypothetical protein